MYKNVGKKIKGVVNVVTKISMTVSIFVGAICIIIGITGVPEAIVWGLVFAPIACLASWLSGLLFYAIGDIADNLLVIRNKIAGEEKEKAEHTVSEEKLLAEGAWKCVSCGRQNPLVRQYCIKCGTSKAWSEEKSGQ